jgi:hypothetical protein
MTEETRPMIPPDYKALERELRQIAGLYRGLGPSVRDVLSQAADALSLAASLQANNERLQDEIERLKGYVQHKDDCLAGIGYCAAIVTGPFGPYQCGDTQNASVHNADRIHGHAFQLPACFCGLAPETGAP